MTKRFKYILYALLLMLVVALLGIHFIAPYAIPQPPRTIGNTSPQDLGLKYEKLSLQTTDEVTLKGYWIKSERDTARGVLLFVHGVGGCKEHFLGLAQELAKRGLESIVFDGRAHGESGGEFCTYGDKEKKDITIIVDKIRTNRPQLPIGIWGNSLGGAIAIQALEIEKRIDFGIIESTFTELDQIVYDYKKRKLYGLGSKLLSDYVLKRAGQVADFNPDAVKPIMAVKNIVQPILIAHGDADQNISVNYGKQLFQNLKSNDKELVIIEGGGHFGLLTTGGVQYKSKILNFIEWNVSH